MKMITETRELRKRCLCCFPLEILLMILSHLSVFDYFSFRAVCKSWRSAFSQCSVIISQSHQQKQLPCFMLLRVEESLTEHPYSFITRRFLYTTGKFGDLSTRRSYTTNMPELCGTQVLLSRHGWLLLHSSEGSSSSLFLLHPFSRAIINLPYIDITNLWNPVFNISAPPTSSECMVFFIGYSDSSAFQIGICRRGESLWTTNVYKKQWVSGRIINVVFYQGMWYCWHQSGSLSVFDTVNNSWRYLGAPDRMSIGSLFSPVTYVIKLDDQLFLCYHGAYCSKIALRDPPEIVPDTCRNIWLGNIEHLFRTSPERAFMQLQNLVQVDSFNAYAWCASYDSEGGIVFRWHNFRSCVNDHYNLNGSTCLQQNNHSCRTIIMWIDQTWIHSSTELAWAL